jgi:multimeric flavodoxin WrbA
LDCVTGRPFFLNFRTNVPMTTLVAIYGSPRRNGNTAVLLKRAVAGARSGGAQVDEFVLRDMKMSPCLEIYGCKADGRCVIEDDFQPLCDAVLGADGLMVASPIFFYSVSAQLKIFMDRCQSLWVKKYWIDRIPFKHWTATRKGIFISVGATRGRKLFDGAMLSMKYFFDVLDTELWRSLLFRGLDFEGDVLKHPAYLEEAHRSGADLADAVRASSSKPPATDYE